jgi:hypothetical protein
VNFLQICLKSKPAAKFELQYVSTSAIELVHCYIRWV